MCLEGLPQFSLDKLVASISPYGLTGKEMHVKGFDQGEKQGLFPKERSRISLISSYHDITP